MFLQGSGVSLHLGHNISGTSILGASTGSESARAKPDGHMEHCHCYADGPADKGGAGGTYKPGSVTPGPSRGRGGDHLSSPPPSRGMTETTKGVRCCHRGRAANPGAGRTPIAPLFGLAPGGVWPPRRRRLRPDALTVRFHPCRQFPPLLGKAPVPSSVRTGGGMFLCHFPSSDHAGSLGVTQHPVQWSPDFPPSRKTGFPVPRDGGHPVPPTLRRRL